MNSENDSYEKNPLWPVLVKTVHSLIMYPHHKRYVLNTLLKKSPDMTPKELSVELNIPLGEALVIFHELRMEKEQPE